MLGWVSCPELHLATSTDQQTTNDSNFPCSDESKLSSVIYQTGSDTILRFKTFILHNLHSSTS